MIPLEPDKDVFSQDVLETWRAVERPSDDLLWRMAVVCACGPSPTDALRARHLRALRATRAAWAAYLEASFTCGMLEGDRGVELRSRLTGIDDVGFRSAISECLACWFLAGKMSFDVSGRAPGRSKKQLDMSFSLAGQKVGVEVKAPFREVPHGTCIWWGDDADKIKACVTSASKQFDKDQVNVLVVVPTLRTPLYSNRSVLMRAAFGESVIVLDVFREGGKRQDPRSEFRPDGKFLQRTRGGAKLLKRDGLPAHRRISAIVCIEEYLHETFPDPTDAFFAASLDERKRPELIHSAEKMCDRYFGEDNEMWIDHKVLVLHNPFAYHRMGEDVWCDFAQLVEHGNHMRWTDGYDCSV